MYMYSNVHVGVYGGQNKMSAPLKLELQVAQTELRSCETTEPSLQSLRFGGENIWA